MNVKKDKIFSILRHWSGIWKQTSSKFSESSRGMTSDKGMVHQDKYIYIIVLQRKLLLKTLIDEGGGGGFLNKYTFFPSANMTQYNKKSFHPNINFFNSIFYFCVNIIFLILQLITIIIQKLNYYYYYYF